MQYFPRFPFAVLMKSLSHCLIGNAVFICILLVLMLGELCFLSDSTSTPYLYFRFTLILLGFRHIKYMRYVYVVLMSSIKLNTCDLSARVKK